MIKIIVSFFILFYLLNALYYLRGIYKLKSPGLKISQFKSSSPLVSIMVSAHNESENISTCLEHLSAQNYPENNLEIIVINDQSEDNTGEIIDLAAAKDTRIIPVHHKRNETIRSFKKQAIIKGLEHAGGEIIVTTDADCTMGDKWLRTMVQQFKANTGMVTGTIINHGGKGIFYYFQSLSNAVLSVTGNAMIANNFPITCHGANMAYRRRAFDEVDGYSGLENIISGDDDLLLQKIAYQSKWQVRSTINPESFVFTDAVDDLMAMVNQYSRWGSKGFKYPSVKVIVYLAFLFLSLSSFYTGLVFLPPTEAGLVWFLKLIADLMMLVQIINIYSNYKLMYGFIPVYLFQPILIFIAVIRGMLGIFRWK